MDRTVVLTTQLAAGTEAFFPFFVLARSLAAFRAGPVQQFEVGTMRH